MNKDNNNTTVVLAVHKNIIDTFHAQPISEKQFISNSAQSEYDIITLESVVYSDVVPTIQQFLPFIKVIMPVELDTQIRKHLTDYDTHDLSKYLEAN